MKKICSKCKENKPLEDYYKDSRHKDGKQSECKSCNNVQSKKYCIEYNQYFLEYQKEYRKSGKGKLADAKYRKSDKGKATNAKYWKSDKGKLTKTKANHTRRAKEKEILKDFIVKESKCILFLQGYKCIHPECNYYFDEVEPTLDHILPVSKGGPLIKDNVQYLCRKHNSKKGIKHIDYRSTIHKQYITTMELIWHNNLNNQYK
jgi:5-methylcytosine-specific restriction endonuclease McrA